MCGVVEMQKKKGAALVENPGDIGYLAGYPGLIRAHIQDLGYPLISAGYCNIRSGYLQRISWQISRSGYVISQELPYMVSY